MCTLSWCCRDDGYALWFNRDERHTRSAEVPPTEYETDGVRWLAPMDPDSGGTWLMANEHGLTVALLNDYGIAWEPGDEPPRESRGRLVPLTCSSREAREATAVIEETVLGHTPPFELIAVDARGGASRLHWDGLSSRLTHGVRVRPPFISSSFDTAAVVAARRSGFPKMADEQALSAFHHSHDAATAAQSVNMSRPDAATRSICYINTCAEWVTLDYEPQCWPGAPRVAGSSQRHRLPRG